MAAQVLAEVVTAAVSAVDGEEAPAPESGEMPAERDGPADTAEATSGPHPEAETPCRVAPGKGSTLSGGGQTYLWSLSKKNSPYAWTGVGCGDGIYFLSLFKGACDTFQNVLSPGFGYTLHI